MPFPISPFIDILNSLICAYCSYQLYRSWQQERKNRIVLYFSQGYLSLIFSYIFFAVPRLVVPHDSYYLGISFIIAQAFLYIAVSFFARVTSSLIKPLWSTRVFILLLFVSLVAVILNIVYFGYPQYDAATGITNWNIQPVVGAVSTFLFAVTLVPSAFFFLWQGWQSRDYIVKVRSTIIGFGLLLLIVTAYTYYTATTETAVLVSDVFSLASYLVIFIGVIYKRNSQPGITTNNS
jgi:hypothetical protein